MLRDAGVSQGLPNGDLRVDVDGRYVLRRHDDERILAVDIDQPAQRRFASVPLELRAIECRARTEQLQLTLQQVVFADLADLEPPLVERIQRVVHGNVRRCIADGNRRRVVVEERRRRVEREVLA